MDRTNWLALKFFLLGMGAVLAFWNGADKLFRNNLQVLGCLLVASVLILYIRKAVKAGEWKELVNSISDDCLGPENPLKKK
jgi:membrane protein implicated in regulation of membrane protease activity